MWYTLAQKNFSLSQFLEKERQNMATYKSEIFLYIMGIWV